MFVPDTKMKEPAATAREPPRMLHLKDLHPIYQSVCHEEAILIANIGATIYESVKDQLHEQWNTTLTNDEITKAAAWEEKGRQEVLPLVKAKTAEIEGLHATLARLEATIQLEVDRSVSRMMELARKDHAIEKMTLEKELAIAQTRSDMTSLLQEKIRLLEQQREELQGQVLELTQVRTRSSNDIGRAGEATVLDLLENTIVPSFPYAEVKDMTTVGHAADFHLWIQSASGKRIKYLIDAKKYKRAVSTDEVKKLCGDVDADEECHAGIMISLDSAICKTKQFQVRRTVKNKPILYLSFQEMDGALQRDVLCWGIQTMMEIVGNGEDDATISLMRVNELLEGLELCVKDIDMAIRTQNKAVEGMKEVRGSLIRKMLKYREGDVIEHEGCDSIIRATGMRCGRSVVEGTTKCSNHSPRGPKTT